jgi:hypothetical protein
VDQVGRESREAKVTVRTGKTKGTNLKGEMLGYLCAVCAEKNGALASIWCPSWQAIGRLLQGLVSCFLCGVGRIEAYSVCGGIWLLLRLDDPGFGVFWDKPVQLVEAVIRGDLDFSW